MTFQELVLALESYWAKYGCAILQPYDVELGAGTMQPGDFSPGAGTGALERRLCGALPPPRGRPLRREPQSAATLLSVPGDPEALAGQHPGGLPQEPAEPRRGSHASTTSASWRTTGSRRRWGPGGSAGRSGWTAWRSPSSPTSSRPAGSNCGPWRARSPTASSASPCSCRAWTTSTISGGTTPLTYGDVHHKSEVEWSVHNFEAADVPLHLRLFDEYQRESLRLIEQGLVLPAYDYLSEVLPHLQHPGCPGGDQRDRAHPLHRPGARPGPTRG